MRQSTATRVFFRTVDPVTGNDVTGLVAADFLGTKYTAIKSDGSKTDVALVLNTNLFEVDSTKAPGLYQLLIAATENNLIGQFCYSVQPAAAKSRGVLGTDEVTSVLADVTNVYSRIGAPVAADISHDIANVYARQGAPAAASISADIANVYSRQGAPAGASQSADVAAVKADTGALYALRPATTIAAALDVTTARDAVWDVARAGHVTAGSVGEAVRHIYQALLGRFRISAPQGADLYLEDKTTIYKSFVLTDINGNPTTSAPAQRNPV